MRGLRRLKQRYPTAIFIISGILVIFVIGFSINRLKQYGVQVRKDQAIAQYEDQKAKKDTEIAKNNEKDAEAPVVVAISQDGVDEKTSAQDETADNSSELPQTGVDSISYNLVSSGFITISLFGYLQSRGQKLRHR